MIIIDLACLTENRRLKEKLVNAVAVQSAS